MTLLGISLPELLLIFLIAVIILGPRDIKKAAGDVGLFLRKVVTSPEWRVVNDATKAIKNLPAKLMREGEESDLNPGHAVRKNSDILTAKPSDRIESLVTPPPENRGGHA